MRTDCDVLTIPLNGSVDSASVGGKGVNIARMRDAGFFVPPAFAVPTGVYQSFLESTGLRPKIEEILSAVDFDNDVSFTEAAGKIREMITSQDIPSDIRQTLDSAVSELNGSYFAVRSSAVAEDLECASFAGQHDTYLNVKPEDIAARTVDCWASYWTDRTVKYRHDAGIPHMEGGIAVVVQKMVSSEISGVMFTSNPIDGSENIVIESTWGLGESVASGIVTPDKFVLDREGNVLEISLKSKDKGYFLIDGKNTLIDIPEEKINERSASDEILRALIEQGLALESYFGLPQDVEWAMEGGQIYILQSRAVTTLADKSEKDDVLWTRAYGDEYWADATTPMFYDVMGKMLVKYVNHEGAYTMGYKDLRDTNLTKLHKSRVYFNTWVLERVFSYYPKFIRSKELLEYFPIKEQERISKYPNNLYRAAMSQVHIIFKDIDGLIFFTNRAYKKWAEKYLKICAEFDSLDLQSLSDEKLLETYHLIEDEAIKHYRLIRYGMITNSILPNLLVKNLLRRWLDDQNGVLFAGLISGLDDNKTVATNVGFSELAKVVRQNPELKKRIDESEPAEFAKWMESTENELKAPFDEFIKQYGHRSNTREILFPRWREDYPYVISIVKMLSDSDNDLKQQEVEGKIRRIDLEKDVRNRLKKTRFGFFKSRAFSFVLKYAQIYLTFRENQRFYLDHILFRQRLLILEFGRRLKERNFLENTEDVFFLYEKEMFDIFNGNLTEVPEDLQARKSEFYRCQNILPPKFLRNGIEFDDTVIEEGQNVINGAAASPGVYTGIAHVVENISGLSKVKEGEILVTSNTDPGWTAVFSRLGALITETGGILSHGAVISREYKIPAVTAVKSARTLIKTGQKIKVDGNSGTIYILEDEENE